MKQSHQLINQDSGNVEYWTPRPIVAVAAKLMGCIDMDPACSYEAAKYHEETHKYTTTYNANGELLPWNGRVWLNPPFGRTHNPIWIPKLCRLKYIGHIDQACCITFASVSEQWFQPLLSWPQYFFAGRINYIDPITGKAKTGVTKGSVFTWLYDFALTDYETARAQLSDEMENAGFKGMAK